MQTRLGRHANMWIDRWDFDRSFGEDRLQRLKAAPPFKVIVERIDEGMEILCCHPDQCDDHVGFKRIIYCISVSDTVFDWFFNSSNGYRAAYYRSPYRGLRANAFVIGALLPALLASAPTVECSETNRFIVESLTSPSAKLWLAEAGRELCHECAGEWTAPQNGMSKMPEIRNNRWEYATGSKAEWGRKAPKLTKIRIFGAFLNEGHDEFIPSWKRHRARHIHQWGWS